MVVVVEEFEAWVGIAVVVGVAPEGVVESEIESAVGRKFPIGVDLIAAVVALVEHMMAVHVAVLGIVGYPEFVVDAEIVDCVLV